MHTDRSVATYSSKFKGKPRARGPLNMRIIDTQRTKNKKKGVSSGTPDQNRSKISSPVPAAGALRLLDGQKNFIIGLDECICNASNVRTERQALEAAEVKGAKEWINALTRKNHLVCLFSERPERLRRATEAWLAAHGFTYSSLILGKPSALKYHYIDDRHVQATTFKGRYTELVRKEHKIEVFG